MVLRSEYKDFTSLVRGIGELEKSTNINKESHHSLILSLLSKTEEVISIQANWGIGLGTPEQIENTSKSIISFSGNREPSTFIIDIDGVIFQHDVGSFSYTGDFLDNPIPIKENGAPSRPRFLAHNENPACTTSNNGTQKPSRARVHGEKDEPH